MSLSSFHFSYASRMLESNNPSVRENLWYKSSTLCCDSYDIAKCQIPEHPCNLKMSQRGDWTLLQTKLFLVTITDFLVAASTEHHVLG